MNPIHSTRRLRGRWIVVVSDLSLGPIPLGYIVRLEDGPIIRAPFPHAFIAAVSPRLKRLLGWWRPTSLGALRKGFREVNA